MDKDGEALYGILLWNGCKPWTVSIEKIELKPDLSGTIGEGKLLFRASESPWSRGKDADGRTNRIKSLTVRICSVQEQVDSGMDLD